MLHHLICQLVAYGGLKTKEGLSPLALKVVAEERWSQPEIDCINMLAVYSGNLWLFFVIRF